MCPVAKTVLPLQGMQVQFLVREVPRAIRCGKKKTKKTTMEHLTGNNPPVAFTPLASWVQGHPGPSL